MNSHHTKGPQVSPGESPAGGGAADELGFHSQNHVGLSGYR